MEEKYHYYFKKPSECNPEELKRFHELVLKGRKVQAYGLEGRIRKCHLLGFCLDGNEIVGVSSLKCPPIPYRESVINHHGIKRKPEELNSEIGYSFTEEKHRRNGISTELKAGILANANITTGVIFSTTAITSSQNFLRGYGFVQVGEPYDGENDKNILYLEFDPAKEKSK